MERLAGRVAVVTGAAGGIGFGIAEALAAEGMRLVLADLDGERLAQAAGALAGGGAELIGIPTDVRDAGSVEALAAAALDAFGAVHVVCNNAGVATMGYQWETPLADWEWVVDVNLWGTVHGVRTFVPILLANPDGGHVVNVASMGGLIGSAFSGPYSATKHAVVGLSKGLRAEFEQQGAQIGVTVVCPGKVATSIVERLNRRPGPTGEVVLPPEVRAVRDAMRDHAGEGVSARDAGQLVCDAIKRDRFWAFPGAQAHLPLLRRELQAVSNALEATVDPGP